MIVTGKGNYKDSAEATFTITSKPLTNGMIGTISPVQYDGTPKTPQVTVTDGGKVLTQGTDYTVSYTNNTNVARDGAGKVIAGAKVTVVGKGNYTGAIENVEFVIEPKSLTEGVTVAGIVDVVYTGSEYEPAVTVKCGETVLDRRRDYVISYKKDGQRVDHCKDVGTYTVIVTGKGNYKDSAEATFKITKAKVIVKVDAKSKVYGTVDPKLTATVKGLVGSDKLIYTLSRAKGENVGEYDITVMLGDNPNYEVIVTGGKFTITREKPHSSDEDPSEPVKESEASKDVGGEDSSIVEAVDGTTYAKVTGNDVVFLREKSGNISTWYALDNSKGAFEKGSTFGVRLLNSTDDSEDWQRYYEKLDDDQKERADNNKLWIFSVDVTKVNGEKYTKLNQPVDLYVQLGADWVEDDIRAVFISDSTDEPLKVEVIPDYVLPDGTVTKMAKVTLKHFSPYAMYAAVKGSGTSAEDKKSGTDGKSEETTKSDADSKSEEATKSDADKKSEETIKSGTDSKSEETTKSDADSKSEEVTKSDADKKSEETIKPGTDGKSEETIKSGTDSKSEETTKSDADKKSEETIKPGTDGKSEETIKSGTDSKSEETTKSDADKKSEETNKSDIANRSVDEKLSADSQYVSKKSSDASETHKTSDAMTVEGLLGLEMLMMLALVGLYFSLKRKKI